jgi:hypothetical protein
MRSSKSQRVAEETMKSTLFALPLLVLGSILLAAGCTVSADPDADVALVTCSDDDVACASDADCCSYLCADDGYCGAPLTSCTVDNAACDGDADCCSNLCADDGYCGLP